MPQCGKGLSEGAGEQMAGGGVGGAAAMTSWSEVSVGRLCEGCGVEVSFVVVLVVFWKLA